MTQQPTTSGSNTLFPQLETGAAPLEDSEEHQVIINIEKDLVKKLGVLFSSGDVLEDIGDKSILPPELFLTSKKTAKPKLDALQPLMKLTTDEVEDEEETDDEEDEDEEAVEDEEEDAGGDYLVSHFDNGENYEDNDEEGDDMTL